MSNLEEPIEKQEKSFTGIPSFSSSNYNFSVKPKTPLVIDKSPISDLHEEKITDRSSDYNPLISHSRQNSKSPIIKSALHH